jgi:hypothetical protein
MNDRKSITRAEAKARGLKRYFTGEPCKHGHIAERYVHNDSCVLCRRERERRWETRHPERKREKWRRWATANREKLRETRLQCYAANPKIRERRRQYVAAHPEIYRAASRRWATRNREKVRERYERRKQNGSEDAAARHYYHRNLEKMQRKKRHDYYKRAGALKAVRELGLSLKRTPKNLTLAMAIIREAQRRLRELHPTIEKE